MRFGFRKILALSAVALAGLILLLASTNGNKNPTGAAQVSLTLYCAAGLQPPVSEILRAYEEANDVSFQTRFDGSGVLLSAIRVAGGDLFVAADMQYLLDAQKQKLVSEILPIANQSPVILVQKGNPKKIARLDDLLRGDIAISLADPKLAAIGRVVQGLLQNGGRWDAIWKKAVIHRETVNQVANDVKLAAADAGIVWDATAVQYPHLDVVRIPAFAESKNEIAVGLLTGSSHAAEARRFALYLTSPEQGQKIFRKYGYAVVGKQAERSRK